MDNQTTQKALLDPQERRRFMFKSCVAEWNPALANEKWNPEPYQLLPEVHASCDLDFYEEREAFRRAQLAAFLHLLHEDDMGLWFKFADILLAPIHCGEEKRKPTPAFVARTLYLEALLLLEERFFDDEWKERIKEYFIARWPEYKGERITSVLIGQWREFKDS